MFDLLIKKGTVIDGTGAPARSADVAIKDGMIAAIGTDLGAAERAIDAAGATVTPGFVDIHCHYDGQVEWDPYFSPSPQHGVTTVVMSNCGVGFAPVRPGDRDMLISLMEGVEDIPNPVLAEGLSWSWETFPEYLDAIAAKPHAIDFAAQLPHGPLRVYVMGQRGADREPATPEDLAQMQTIVRDAMKAGALGFTTSRTILHKTSTGDPTPMLDAAEEELRAIALAMRDVGTGVIELVSDFGDIEGEFAMLERLVGESGRPLTFSLAQRPDRPEAFRRMLALVEAADAKGLPIRGQVIGRPIGVLLGLDTSAHPFFANREYLKIADLPLAERATRMRDPAIKAAILSAVGDDDPSVLRRFPPYIALICREPRLLYRLGDPPCYLPDPDTSAGSVAEREGLTAFEVVYDWMVERDGRELLYLTLTNYAWGDDRAIREMINHPLTVYGLSDGGAHYGMICDASAPTFMLRHWAGHPDPARRLRIEEVVHRLTQRPAKTVGLEDRGVLAPGYRADLNIIDIDRLELQAPHIVRDLPTGGRRLTQSASGYRSTIVAGEEVFRQGQPTGAMPGKLVRSFQRAPQAA